MDIGMALTAIQQSLGIVKSIRDMEKGAEISAYKNQIADLYGDLADIKIALSDAKVALNEKDLEIRELKSEIENLKSGELCEKCREGRMELVTEEPDPTFGVLGAILKTYKCNQCSHVSKKSIDP